MIKEAPSPNFSARPTDLINCLVIHDTGGHTVEGTLTWFANPNSKVSSHYVIGRNGQIYRCVDDADKAWHAGLSTLWGEENVNNYSIGIELVDDNDKDPYPSEQITSLITLCTALCHAYKIPLNRVVGHCDVAPKRKIDPGKDFPWVEFLMTLGARVSDLYFKMEDTKP